MAQAKKTDLNLKKKVRGQTKSTPWYFWAIGGAIVLVVIVVLALVVSSFMPSRQPSYGSIPTAAESQGATSGSGQLPPVSKGERASMIDGAKQSGVQITDEAAASVRYDKDQSHAILSIPTGSGNSFRVKTYRLTKQGDGGWARP